MTLTKTQLEVLKVLQFREAPPGAPCWVVLGTRSRYRLVVWTLMRTWAHQQHVAGRTLRTLHEAGLVEYGPDVKPPFERREGDAAVGSTVTLTDAGRAAIGGGQ